MLDGHQDCRHQQTVREARQIVSMSLWQEKTASNNFWGGNMELNTNAQKEEFLAICRASIQREGLEDLLIWMGKADFFTAPASTKYHGAYIQIK